MALFTNVSEEEKQKIIQEQVKNKYLDDPEQGILLIKHMLTWHKKAKYVEQFEAIVNDRIFPILAELELQNELELYRKLIKISDQIQERKKIQVLNGKKIIGVGGKFSAGKSSFINAITNSNLPEGQRPTTSIATYILAASARKNVAITMSDKEIELDDMALEALTHQFYDKYHIGFSKLIQNLVVHTPYFPYPNIAILDTPGYSKSDENKNKDDSDAELAMNQLKAVDYLVWLVDSTQGVITAKDLEFLDKLNVSTPILVVFTKADTETPENLKKKIEQARIALQTINKEIYDVIAYNSRDRVTVLGEGKLEAFFKLVNNDYSNAEQNEMVLKSIKKDLIEQLTNQIKSNKALISDYEKVITNAQNINNCTSIINDYQRKVILTNRIQECKTNLIGIFPSACEICRKLK